MYNLNDTAQNKSQNKNKNLIGKTALVIFLLAQGGFMVYQVTRNHHSDDLAVEIKDIKELLKSHALDNKGMEERYSALKDIINKLEDRITR